jgi:uncharacterized repeat protein (TIGR01451 family)
MLNQFRFVLAMPLMLALVFTSCSSTDAGRPFEHQYHGSGQHSDPAKGTFDSRAGWRNTRGHLGDQFGRRTPAPAPVVAAPVKPAPVKPAPAPAPAPMVGSTITMCFPTGDPRTSVVCLEKSAPAEVMVGQVYSYDMKVTNMTDTVLESVQVIGGTQGNFSMASSDPMATPGADGKAVWNLGRMGPRESRNIRVTGSATGAGEVTCCVEVKWNSLACVTTRVVSPALQLQKAAPAEVLSCDEVEMTFTVSNSGTGMARNVVITDQLPGGWKTMDGASTLSIPVGNLAGGETRTVPARVRAGATGSYQNTASATADGGLTTNSNTTTTVVRNCALVITKTAPERRFAGRPVEYGITVRNTGDGIAKNVVLEDMLPGGVTLISASNGGALMGNKVTWNLGNIAPNGSANVTLTVNPTALGLLRNTATVTAYCCGSASASAETRIEGIPAVLLEVVDDPDPVEVGNEIVYTIRVTNQGSADGTNIRIDAFCEEGQQFVSATGATASSAAPGASTINFAPLAVLAPKATATWTVRVRASSEGDKRFRVAMNTDQIGRPVDETESSNFYR